MILSREMMTDKKSKIYIYPHTQVHYQPGINDYIPNLVTYLGRKCIIVNKPTKIGLLDLLKNIFKCDIIYFNWIEDLAHKKYGYLQIPLLLVVLFIGKLRSVKIVWFIHNNVSHVKKNLLSKKMIVLLMNHFSTIILSHVREVNLKINFNKFFWFDHPVSTFHPISSAKECDYDLLIWGHVAPYKGVAEFVSFSASSEVLRKSRILIAGRFSSEYYYKSVTSRKTKEMEVINKLLTEEDLIDLMSRSRYVLFTYNSSSVLSSAALCKSLSYGREVIGPDTGAFRELSSKGLIHTYRNLEDLDVLLEKLYNNSVRSIKADIIAKYANQTSWDAFGEFLHKKLVLEN